MTVFIAHADNDRPSAEGLEKYLERRGLFVELENGVRGFRHAQPSDTVVALWSRDTVFSPHRLLLEKRTMEAWADEQLVLVKLDHAFSPVGLRDLPSIDASFEAQRDIAWAAVARQAQTPRQPASPAQPAVLKRYGDLRGMTGGRAPPAQAKGAGRSVALLALLLAVAVAGVAAAWMARDRLLILPPSALQPWLPAAGAALALLLIAATFLLLRPRRRGPAAPAGAAPAGEQLFVSYAHADNMAVVPVVEAVQAQGRSVWLDRGDIAAGEGWAGEIVRAIKAARGVIVMCSARAFESDHVKREVYLADRYKKPMLPVFLEPAAPPEDFEYFFAGVQWLELHKTPAADRPAAIAKALRAV
jgi:hypothetical protein